MPIRLNDVQQARVYVSLTNNEMNLNRYITSHRTMFANGITCLGLAKRNHSKLIHIKQ